MNLFYVFIGLYIALIVSIGGYIAYQFISGNWKLFIDYEDREYDCENCDGLPWKFKRQAD